MGGGAGNNTCSRSDAFAPGLVPRACHAAAVMPVSAELAPRGGWIPRQKVPSSAEGTGQAGYLCCAGAESGLSPELIARVAETPDRLSLAAVFISNSSCCDVSARTRKQTPKQQGAPPEGSSITARFFLCCQEEARWVQEPGVSGWVLRAGWRAGPACRAGGKLVTGICWWWYQGQPLL